MIKYWTRIARVTLICLLYVLLLSGNDATLAQSPNRAALVIQYSDGTVWTQCIDFAEPEITGLDVLSRSGLDITYSVTSGTGALVCRIGPDGCDNPSNCLCQCKGADCVYWSYWHLIDGAWQYSRIGASDHTVRPGDVEGWVWGPGSIAEAPEPPMVRFEDICRSATSTPVPTDTPLPTDTPSPTDAPASEATHTPTPTSTPAPLTETPSPNPSLTPAATQTLALAAQATSTPVPTQTRLATPTSMLTPAPPPTATPSLGNYLPFAGIIAVLAAIGFIVRQKGKPEVR